MYSRAVGCCPMFFVAPAYNFLLKSMNLMPKPKTPLGNIVELFGIAIGLWITQPANCGWYPQMMNIDVDKLEPEIQKAAKAKGFQVLQYNKGL